MIRPVQMKDLDQVAALEALCFPMEEAASKLSLKSRIQHFSSSFLVMEKDGSIVGMINGCVCHQKTISDDLYEDASKHDPNGSYQTIFGLDVHPAYQHLGLACQLMEAMIQKAKEENRQGLVLTCKQHLISFYEQFGYQSLGISQSTHGNVVWYDMLLEFGGEVKK